MKGLLRIWSKLPVGVHYFLADWLIYPLLMYIVRYRRKLVWKNLKNSFPEKTDSERKTIMKAFYHQLASMVAEVIYGYTASEEEMRKRMVFIGYEDVAKEAKAHGGAIFMLGHMGNWDWLAEIEREVSPSGVTECNIYRKQRSKFFDRLVLDIRASRGGICVEKQQLLRAMIQHRQEGTPHTYGLISDQKPQPRYTRLWTEFLHQETGFLDGGEMLAKKFDYPIYYVHITRPKRGYYEARLLPITKEPKTMAENAITEQFARMLEANIKESPELWLWTHNRWKWKKS